MARGVVKKSYKTRTEQAKALERTYDQYLRADKSLNEGQNRITGRYGQRYRNSQYQAYEKNNPDDRMASYVDDVDSYEAVFRGKQFSNRQFDKRTAQLRQAADNRIKAIMSATIGG